MSLGQMVDHVVKYILHSYCFIILLIKERGMVKYSTLILDLPLPPFSSASLASCILKLFFLLCVYVFTDMMSSC